MKKSKLQLLPIIFTTLITIWISFSAYNYVFIAPKVINSDTISDIQPISTKGYFVVPFSHLMNKRSVEENFKITPYIEGSHEWTGKTLKFIPNQELTKDELYSIHIDKNAENILGKSLGENTRIHFEVQDAPSVIYTSPENLTDNHQPIVVMFSQPMNDIIREQEIPKFKITPNTPGTWKWKTNSMIQFIPKNKLTPSTKYEITIPAGIMSSDGSTTEKSHTWSFHTEPIQYLSHDEWNGDNALPLLLHFSETPDRESVKDHIRITNKNDKVIEASISYQEDTEDKVIKLIPEKGWEFDTTYKVQVKQGIKSKEGNITTNEEDEITIQTEQGIKISGASEDAKYGPSGIIVIESTKDMELVNIKNNLIIKPETDFTVHYTKNDSQKSITALLKESPNTLEVLLKEDTSFKDGNKYLPSPISQSFTKAAPLKIQELDPDGRFGYKYICIISNNALNPESLKNNLEIYPSSEIQDIEGGRIEKDTTQCSNKKIIGKHYTRITTKLKPKRNYEVTLENIEDIYGQISTEKKEIHFQTPPIQPGDIEIKTPEENLFTTVSNINTHPIEVSSLNTEKIQLRACELSMQTLLNRDTKDTWENFTPSSNTCKKIATKEIQINNPYWNEQKKEITFVEIFNESLTNGIYYIDAISKDSHIQKRGFQKIYISSEIDIFSKNGFESTLTWVTDKTGVGIKDVELTFYNQQGRKLFSGTTDSEGIYIKSDEPNKVSYISATKDGEISLLKTQWSKDIDHKDLGVRTQRQITPLKGYIYTDQNIYTPEEEVYFRGIVRSHNDGALSIPKNKRVSVAIKDTNLQELHKQTYTLDTYGTFQDSITLDSDTPTGKYTIITCLGSLSPYCDGEEIYTFIEVVEANTTYTAQKSNEEEIKEANKTSLQGSTLKISTDKDEYEIGEEAKLTVLSKENSKTLMTIERENILSYKLLEIQKGKNEITIPITSSYIPNIFISLVTKENGKPDQVIYKEIGISKESKKIAIEVESEEDGDDMKLIITTKDWKGNPLPSSISLKQEALDQETKENTANNIQDTFYGESGNGIQNAMTKTKPAETETLDQEKLKTPEPITAKKKTTLWISERETDENGRVEIHIPKELQSHLSNIHIIAISRETQIGSKIYTLTSGDGITMLPITPNFLRMGEKISLGIKLTNGNQDEQGVRLNLETENLTLLSTNEKIINIKPLSQEVIYFEGITNVLGRNSLAKITFSTFVDNNETRREIAIPLINDLPRNNITTAITIDQKKTEKEIMSPATATKESAELKIHIDATRASQIIDNMTQLLASTQSTTESLINKISPTVSIYSSLNQESFEAMQLPGLRDQNGNNMKFADFALDTLQKIYELQKSDGSWGLWKDAPSSIGLTGHIALSLNNIRNTEIAVSTSSINKAKSYLTNILYNTPEELRTSDDLWKVRAYIVYTLSEIGTYEIGFMNRIQEEIEQLSETGKLHLALAYQNAGLHKNTETIFDDIVNKILIGKKGAWLYDNKPISNNLQTSKIQRTALILKLLLKIDPLHELIPDVADWLVSQNETVSSRDHAETIFAIAALIKKTTPNEKEIQSKVRVNGITHLERSYTKENYGKQNYLSIPFSYLEGYPNKNSIQFQKEGTGKLFAKIKTSFTNNIIKQDTISQGIGITNQLFANNVPVTTIGTDKKLTGITTIFNPQERKHIIISIPLPAGATLLDIDTNEIESETKQVEIRNNKIEVLVSQLPKGTYQVSYELTTKNPGTFLVPSSYIYANYQPQIMGRSENTWITIQEN